MKFTAMSNLFTLKSSVMGVYDSPKLKKMAEYISDEINEVTTEVLIREAEKLARLVKEEINFQPPAWPPLNETYRQWKDKNGLNTDMLKATESYWNAIAVQEKRDSRGRFASYSDISDPVFSIRVGLPFTKHPGMREDEGGSDDSELRYDQLAAILEYGTEHIPARPHWAPAYRRWRSQHLRSVKARIMSLAVRKYNNAMKNVHKGRKTFRT